MVATNPSEPGETGFPSYIRHTGLLLLAMAVYLIFDQQKWWATQEDYSFGYIVPLFVGYVLYDRWGRIKAFLRERKWEGEKVPTVPESGAVFTRILVFLAWCGTLGGLALFTLGGFLQALSNNPLLPGGQALAYGFAAVFLSLAFIGAGWAPTAPGQTVPVRYRFLFTGLFVFPAVIWIISLPLLDFAETKLSLFLLEKVTVIVFNTFDILGIPLERQGNVLILEKGQVGVEDACSGIRSLTACLFAGSFLAAVFLNRWWKKILLVACAMVFAFIMNLFRSLFLTSWAHLYGSDAIAGKVHDITGYAVLGFTCVGLLLLLPIFNFRLQEDESPDADGESLSDEEGESGPETK